jgi:hypothetical protein
LTAAESRPELQDTAAADDDGDGHVNNRSDPDNDGLDTQLENMERTRCARVSSGAYSKGVLSDCSDVTYPFVFNNNMDGDAFGGGLTDTDSNSDCNASWGVPNACDSAGLQVCVWTAAAGYTADTFSSGASGGIGCDGPEFFSGRSPQNINEDADGLVLVKSLSSISGPYGASRVVAFGLSGAGGCTIGEEAALGLNNNRPRDLRDVNNSGKVDATDIAGVRAAFGAIAGSSPLYKRSLDLDAFNTTAASGGRGSGKVDATDVLLVRAQFQMSCQTAP